MLVNKTKIKKIEKYQRKYCNHKRNITTHNITNLITTITTKTIEKCQYLTQVPLY